MKLPAKFNTLSRVQRHQWHLIYAWLKYLNTHRRRRGSRQGYEPRQTEDHSR